MDVLYILLMTLWFFLNTLIWIFHIRIYRATSFFLIAYFVVWFCHNVFNHWPSMDIYKVSSPPLLHTMLMHNGLYKWIVYLLYKFIEVKYVLNGKWIFNFVRYSQISFKVVIPLYFMTHSTPKCFLPHATCQWHLLSNLLILPQKNLIAV